MPGKTPQNTPVWLVNPNIEQENRQNFRLHYVQHILPRMKEGKQWLDFDSKCEFDLFCQVRDSLVEKWDNETLTTH